MSTSPRVPRHRYVDPLDRIWLVCAERFGFKVVRDGEVYASSDGRGTLTVGTPETLDPDDSLAQILFHEICHALVEGQSGIDRPDWGLDNMTTRDAPREEACLRLQAALAGPYGLRGFLAPTTDFRAFYDALPVDPLTPADDPTVIAAKAGAARADQPPWAPHLADALAATMVVARTVAAYTERGAFQEGEARPLYAAVEAPTERHRSGFPLARAGSPAADGRCGSCVWRYESRGGARCRQADGARIEDGLPACERWEAALDCQTCGACCREAYDSVTVSSRDPFVKAHPELVVRREVMLFPAARKSSAGPAVSTKGDAADATVRARAASYLEVRRNGERCAALEGGRGPGERYACRVYEDRPRCCRELAAGGGNCLWARRRVGLSR